MNAATRCCRLTGNGRGAVAVVLVAGPAAAAIIAKHFHGTSDSPLRSGQVRYGTWSGTSDDRSQHAGESIVVTPLSEVAFEVHCHGGSAAVDAIMRDIKGSGAVDVDPWSVHAAATQKSSLLETESLHVASRCTTALAAGYALSQVYRKTGLLAWAESVSQRTPLTEIQRTANEILRHAAWSRRLDRPFRVVLIGPPNVGKSSLTNAIVGYQRSITWDQPGTTRDLLHADTVIAGIPIRLTDTAGVRNIDVVAAETSPLATRQQHAIEAEGIRRSFVEIESADLILTVATPTQPIDVDVRIALDRSTKAKIEVLNKADLTEPPVPPGRQADGTVATVALSPAGIDDLMDEIAKRLIPDRPPIDVPLVLNDRQHELMRRIATAAELETAVHAIGELLRGTIIRP